MTSTPLAGIPGTTQERTFIAIKPDGSNRGLVGGIIGRFEKKGYKLVAMKMLTPTKEQAAGHYADLKSKPFFKGLVEYFCSGPVVAMCFEGINAIAQGRVLLGATNPKDSSIATIRGDLCVDIGRNICHGSDGVESAKHEIEFWFGPNDASSHACHARTWVYENPEPVAPKPSASSKKPSSSASSASSAASAASSSSSYKPAVTKAVQCKDTAWLPFLPPGHTHYTWLSGSSKMRSGAAAEAPAVEGVTAAMFQPRKPTGTEAAGKTVVTRVTVDVKPSDGGVDMKEAERKVRA